jgi:hypothetical protein
MQYGRRMIIGNTGHPAGDRTLGQARTAAHRDRESSDRSTGGVGQLRGDPAGLMGLLILGSDSGRSPDESRQSGPSAIAG